MQFISPHQRQEMLPAIQHLFPLLLGTGDGPDYRLKNFGPVLQDLDQQQLLPLLYRQVMLHGGDSQLSADILALIRGRYVLAVQQAAREEEEVLEVRQRLEQARVPVLLLKGADLRVRVYGDAAVRPMVDLDLLIPETRVPGALAVLEEGGYVPHPDPLPGFRARFRQVWILRPPAGKSLPLDLHCGEIRAFQGFYVLPYERLAAQAVSLEEGERYVHVLSPEHLLLHLCLHTCHDLRHAASALQFLDISLTLLRLPIDWSSFLTETARFSCQFPVYRVFKILAGLVPGIIPTEVLAQLSRTVPSRMEKVIHSRLGFLPLFFLPFYQHPHLRDWIFFLRAKIWPQASYRVGLYGNYLAYLRKIFRKRTF